MRIIKFSVVIILTATFLTSCLNDNKSNNNNNNNNAGLILEEGEEQLSFKGESGDFEKTSKFELYKIEYYLELSFDNDIINYYKKADKSLQFFLDQKPENPTEELYNMFLNDSEDLYLLEGLLETIRYRNNGSELDMVQHLVAFVQSIPYEIAVPQKYPYETLYLNKGDCSDKSVLLCKLLTLEGYETCLFVYEKAEHMAVGLKVDNGEDSYHSGFCYIESTAFSPIGKIPEEMVGGIKIDEDPEIIYPFENGDNIYQEYGELKSYYNMLRQNFGKGYLQTSIKGKNLLEEMQMLAVKKDSLKNEQDSLNKVLDALKVAISDNGCNGIVDESIYEDCVKINNTYNKNVEIFNNLNVTITNTNDNYNQKVLLYNAEQKK